MLHAAKTQYGTILANVDWLHGGAESLLTITNLMIGEPCPLISFHDSGKCLPICAKGTLNTSKLDTPNNLLNILCCGHSAWRA